MKSNLLILATLVMAGVLFAGSLRAALSPTSNMLTSINQSSPFQTGGSSSSNSSSSKSATSTSTPSSQSSVSTAAASDSSTSANWAGYEASGNDFTSISGTWTVPTVSASGITSADATWIGIGGVSTDDLIQVGTQNVVSPDGDVSSAAFYELLPSDSIDPSTIDVNPGDSITASLKETSIDYWTISIKDNTNGSSFTTNVEYDSSENSAEWIEEDPSSVDSQIPFDDFGSVTFSNASAIENGSSVNLSTSKAQALNMVDEYDQELASTSALTSDDKGFTVTRSDSEPEQVVQEYEGYTGGFSRHGEGIGQSYGYSPYGDGFGGYYENDGFGNGYGRF